MGSKSKLPPLLNAHPEILTFKQDQMQMSRPVAKYIAQFRLKYPSIIKALSRFRRKYAETKKITFNDIQDFYRLTGWTHTDSQRRSAIDFLRNVSSKYPVPKEIADHVKPGLKLDISKIKDQKTFTNKLDQFIGKIRKLPLPTKVKIDLSEVGYLPISLIHQSSSTDYIDPLLKGKVDTIWTLDVSINPGLSVKDVIAKYMVQAGVKQGTIKKSTILVEGTSGNTGAGIAIAAAAYGYKSILVIPDKMSPEKISRLQAMGAHTIITPTQVAADDPKSYYMVRDYIASKTNGWRGNQYDNPANTQSHYETTGPMIWEQTKGEVTAVIATAGTSGTISGVGRYLKKKNPKIKMIAVDSVGSILYLLKLGYTIDEVQEYATGYKIQGFGEDIYPRNLDLGVVDAFLRVGDKTGLTIAQILPALGYINGQSSGAAYAGLIEAIDRKLITKHDKVVVIFPDIGFTYRGDLYDDKWMKNNKFLLTWR